MVGRLLPSEQPLELMYFYMAPPDGLEPPHDGIKIRCLTSLANLQLNYLYFLLCFFACTDSIFIKYSLASTRPS